MHLAEDTVKRYVGHLDTLLKSYGVNPYELTEDQVYEIKNEMMQRGYAASYINKKLVVIQHWFQMHGVEAKFKLLPESEKVVDYLE